MLGAPATPSVPAFPVVVIGGAHLVRAPQNAMEAEATVNDLIALGADFTAGPLAINGRDFATYGVTPRSVFDPCALARGHAPSDASRETGTATVSAITALLRQSFGARITDTIRPTNATYGAQYSWHKVGQAVDFVPAGGVGAVDRTRIRALMAAHGVRLLELLGPGDRGHSNHWHIAFARPGQIIDHMRTIEGAEDWMIDLAGYEPQRQIAAANGSGPPNPKSARDAKAPPAWDVFATAEWRALQGGG